MLAASIPVKFTIPWANSAGSSYIRAVPTPSQIGVAANAASLTDGFPPQCFAAGGAPDGRDFNGILQTLTQWQRWYQAGGAIVYDAAFQTAINGYPNGAIVTSAVTAGLNWQSFVDGNMTNPDTGGAGWVSKNASSITGQARNLIGVLLSVTSAKWTADEVVVKTALGGAAQVIATYNQTLSFAATGAGGLDAGTLAASTWYYVYAIYNSTTGAAGILATTAGTGQLIYPGSNMPSGYTYSSLISALRTNSSAQFSTFSQRDNGIFGPTITIGSGLSASSLTAINLASAVPPNAKTTYVGVSNFSASENLIELASDSAGVISAELGIQAGLNGNFYPVTFLTAQTIYYAISGSGPNATMTVAFYTI